MKINSLISIGSVAVSSIALNFLAVGQALAVNLVTNGGFVPTGTTQSSILRGGVTLNGWTFSTQVEPGNPSTNTGFNFVVPDGTAFQENIDAAGNSGNPITLQLYGNPGQTVNSQADASGGAASGWYIAADAFFERGAINQTLTGLTIGQNYTVSFSQAYGQQDTENPANNFTQPFSEFWTVGFGNSFQNAATMTSTGAEVVSPWQQQSLSFTAQNTSEVLSFLAQGTNDVPPFALLSGVSVEAQSGTLLPEPADFLGSLIGLGVVGLAIKHRQNTKKSDE